MSYYEHSKCPSCGYDFNLETKDSDSLLKEVEKKNITVFNICKKSIDFSLDAFSSSFFFLDSHYFSGGKEPILSRSYSSFLFLFFIT
mgnify:CR=1 FL=1